MNINSLNPLSAFEGCYMMQPEDIRSFADTLADGFSQYDLFKYVCGKEYNHSKMSKFWEVSLALLADNAICIADSKEANSVLVYIRPKSKEPSALKYIKAGGLKMLWKMGARSAFRLLRFDAEAQKVAKRHRTDNDGYIMGFATRIDKQGQNYGKPLIEALLSYLDISREGCYLETLKAKNVDLYKRFSYELKEQTSLKSCDLMLYAMHRK